MSPRSVPRPLTDESPPSSTLTVGFSGNTIYVGGTTQLAISLSSVPTDNESRARLTEFESPTFTITLPGPVVATSAEPITGSCGLTATALAPNQIQVVFAVPIGNIEISSCPIAVPVTSPYFGDYTLGTGSFSPDPVMPGTVLALSSPTLHVLGLPQTIDFTQPGNVSVAAGTATVHATATLPVVFTSTTHDVCTVVGATVTLHLPGLCSITASQPGNSTYAAATPVTLHFTVQASTPDTVIAVAGISSIDVSWHAPSNATGITGYTATAHPGPSTCTTTGATSCVMGGTAGTTYTVTVVTHFGAANSGESAASNEATPTAPAPPASPPDTNLTLTTDKGLITTATPSQRIVFIGTGFAPYSTVVISIYSTPTILGTVVTDANGNFSKEITIPAGLATGEHTAVAQGVAPDGTPRAMELAIKVARTASSSGSGLPTTGAPLSGILTTALLLLTAGAAMRIRSRRRPG